MSILTGYTCDEMQFTCPFASAGENKKERGGIAESKGGEKIIAEVGAKGTVIEGKVLELGYIWGQMSGLRCRGR